MPVNVIHDQHESGEQPARFEHSFDEDVSALPSGSDFRPFCFPFSVHNKLEVSRTRKPALRIRAFKL
jgi:hypothetical protein